MKSKHNSNFVTFKNWFILDSFDINNERFLIHGFMCDVIPTVLCVWCAERPGMNTWRHHVWETLLKVHLDILKIPQADVCIFSKKSIKGNNYVIFQFCEDIPAHGLEQFKSKYSTGS